MADDDASSDTDDGQTDDAPAPKAGDRDALNKRDWESEASKWRELARKHEAENKRLRPLADKAKDLEDAGRSDFERASADAQSAMARATKAEQDSMRLRVALRKGLSEVQAKRLVGDTEEDLETDADELLTSFRPKEEPKDEKKPEDESNSRDTQERDPNVRRRPQERLRSGAIPDADNDVVETNPRKLAEMIPRDVLG